MTDTALRIPGLLFRPLQAGDAAGLLAVFESRKERDNIDPLSTFESVPTLDQVTGWLAGKADAHDPETFLVVEAGSEVIGCSWLEWWTETTGVRLFLAQAALRPEWRGRGIGSALLHWAEARLRAVASAQTDTGQADTGAAFFGTNATETEADDTALLLGAGYQRAFSVVELEWDARADLSAALPDGLTLRPLLPEHWLAVGRSVTEAYATSTFSLEPSDGQDEKQVEWLRGFDPALCFVAWDGDEVAGQVLCRVERNHGEIAEVSIRAPWRRRGLAKALLAEALRAFRAREIAPVRLHTVAENQYGSVSLYQSVGFQILKHHVRYRKPIDSD